MNAVDITSIACNVHQGSREDAQWFSFGVNKDHDKSGLRRTNADKQRAVEAALRHPKGGSDRAIADHVGVGHAMVSRFRKGICLNETDAPTPSDPPTRDVTRNGKTFTMKVGKIGKINRTAPPPEPETPIAIAPDPLPRARESPRRVKLNLDSIQN